MHYPCWPAGPSRAPLPAPALCPSTAFPTQSVCAALPQAHHFSIYVLACFSPRPLAACGQSSTRARGGVAGAPSCIDPIVSACIFSSSACPSSPDTSVSCLCASHLFSSLWAALTMSPSTPHVVVRAFQTARCRLTPALHLGLSSLHGAHLAARPTRRSKLTGTSTSAARDPCRSDPRPFDRPIGLFCRPAAGRRWCLAGR